MFSAGDNADRIGTPISARYIDALRLDMSITAKVISVQASTHKIATIFCYRYPQP